MNKKMKITLTSFTSIGLLGAIYSIIAINNIFLPARASECEHTHVEHYEAGVTKGDKPGYREHWACCNCHKAWSDSSLKNEIGRTADYGSEKADRSKIDCYDIDWNKQNSITKEYLYKDIAKAATTIKFFQSESTDGVKCGETSDDLIYYSYDRTIKELSVWSNKLIRFKDNDHKGEYVSDHGFFEDCVATSIDLANIETSAVDDFQKTFSNTKFLTQIKNIDRLDASNATSLWKMFYYAEKLTSIDLTDMVIPKVKYLDCMFEHCKELIMLDISSFVTSSVSSFERMFYDCSQLKTIYANTFDFSSLRPTYDQNMFYNCNKIIGEKGTVYSSSNVNGLYARIDKGDDLPGYFSIGPMIDEEWNKDHGVIPVIDGNTLTFGLYPQSRVTDNDLIAELEKFAPSSDEEYFFYNKEYYVKYTGNSLNSNHSFLDGKKIKNGETYFFKCEAIKWNIKTDAAFYTIDCLNILDAHNYDADSNIYNESELRNWLNNDFYNKAFSIKTTSSYIVATDLSDVSVIGDKVWIGSYEQYFEKWYKTNEERKKKLSDFAICKLGRNSYWTRSLDDSSCPGYGAWMVTSEGKPYVSGVYGVHGISPSLTINKY